MKFGSTTVSSTLALSVFFASNNKFTQASVFDTHIPTIGHVRTDPIVDTQCLSGHVHSFYGPKALWPDTTHEDLRKVPTSDVSGTIEQNKSLYWHPTVYHKSGGTYHIVEATLGVYYIWDQNDPSVRAFPPGFAMIAGGVGKVDPRAELNFVCEDTDTDYDTFPTTPCDVFFIEFKMPNCWNGKDRDVNDSHVTYSDSGSPEVDDKCPPGFDKIPQIWLFIEWENYKGGEHIFSDGTDVLHVDYFNGWDQAELLNALQNCDGDRDEFGPIGGSACSQFSYKREGYQPSELFPTSLITDEKVTGITELVLGKPKDFEGACHPDDQPKQGGSPPPPPVPDVPPPPPPPPVVDEPPAPVPDDDPEQNEEECVDICWDKFHRCEDSVDDKCGDLRGDEEDECFDNEERRCRKKRRKCIRAC